MRLSTLLPFCFACISDSLTLLTLNQRSSVLDYLSDYICCLYGIPGAYGVVTMPFSVREVTRLVCVAW